MKDQTQDPDNPIENPTEEDLARPGGKHQWDRLVDSVPSSEENDPKREDFDDRSGIRKE